MIAGKAKLLLGIVSVLVLTGCATQKKQLEHLGVISAIGYDAADAENLLGTVVLPNFTETGKEQVDVLSSKGHTSKQMRFNLSRLSERKLVSGQIRVVLYGEELARKGVLPLSDTLFRDAEIGSQMHLAVTEGKAAQYFLKRYPDKPSVDLYLYKMLRKEMDQNTIPKSNLHRFIRAAYDVGSDPVLPYLRPGKDDVLLDGVAVFRDDKFVGLLSAEEARYLSYLMGGNRNGEVDADLAESSPHGNHAHAVLMYLRVKRAIDLVSNGQAPSYKIKMDVEGAITEYTGAADMEDMKAVARIEKELAKQMRLNVLRVLEKLQTYNSDPVGFGEIYRSSGQGGNMTKDQWHKIYKKSTFDVSVNVKVLQTGMIH